MFNLVKYRYLFLLLSLLVIIPGTISLLVVHLNLGIDFAGGANIEFRPSRQISVTEATRLLAPLRLDSLQIVSGDNTNLPANQTVWISFSTVLDKGTQNALTKALQTRFGQQISDSLSTLSTDGDHTVATVTGFPQAASPSGAIIQQLLSDTAKTNPELQPASATVTLGTTTETVTILTLTAFTPSKLVEVQSQFLKAGNIYTQTLSNATVSGTVASETTRNAFLAVLASALFIVLYVVFAFRKVQKPWRYGVSAIVALLHDVLVVLGIFSILGWTLHIQIDSLFITALLTVVGFSVHDTIVVFDRIRENMRIRTAETFEEVVNTSLIQTMARSLNTSLTVLVTLSALTLFGGESIRNFTLALLIGIFSGTYSSIFNASMILVMWEKGELNFSRYFPSQGRTLSIPKSKFLTSIEP